jgi:hypothetical protein
MHTEVIRTYPVPLKMGFDYVDDFRMWPSWYVGMTNIIDPGHAAWLETGDEIRFGYKLLGRHLEGVAVLEERIDGELVRFHTDVPGLPGTPFRYHLRV